MKKSELDNVLWGWPRRAPAGTARRARKAIRMLCMGDDHIEGRCRDYDACFEMGDGAGVVRLIRLAAERDHVIRKHVLRSRHASPDWLEG